MSNVYLLIAILIVFQTSAVAQFRQIEEIQGIVYNKETQRPISRASIRTSHSGNQAVSDLNGVFKIKVNEKDTIDISFLGFHEISFVPEMGKETYKVELIPNENELDEVTINSGYQKIKPNEATGAFQVLTNADLQQQTGTNILRRLNHIANGVQFRTLPSTNNPMQKMDISIRGLSSINGPLDPLIVLDGYIYEGAIDNIDPNSIESVSILKDAAATSIWGARAGNGVIVLTSKNASLKPGQRTVVSFQNSTTLKQKTDFGRLYQMPNDEFIAIEQFLFNEGYYDRQIQSNPWMSITPVTEILLARRMGEISARDSAESVNRLKGYNSVQEYSNHLLSTPILNQSFLNISGSEGKYGYNLGMGYSRDRNENRGLNNRLNFNFGNSFRVLEDLTLNLNLNYVQQHSQSGTPGLERFNYGGKKVPYMHFFDEHGSPIPQNNLYRRVYLDEYYSDKLLDWNYYPLTDYLHSKSIANINQIYSVFNVNYKAFPFLELNIGGQFQKEQSTQEKNDDKESYYARNNINSFSEIDSDGNVIHNIPAGGINTLNSSTSSSYTIRGQVNFSRKFKKHSITGILGSEMRQNSMEGSSYTAYGYSENPLSSSPVDFTRTFNVLPNNWSSSILGRPDFSKTINRFVSIYTNWIYIYEERYGLSGSIRRDGANIFGAQTNERWSPLWSVGGFWNLSKETWFNSELFPYLKLRATYGSSGNVDTRRSPMPIASVNTGKYTNFPSESISALNDPSLRWELVKNANLGVDFATAGSLLSGSIDFYIKKGKDLYGVTEYDYSVWGAQGTINKNIAGMRGTGLEVNIKANMVHKAAFDWSSHLLFNLNKHKTTAYFGNTDYGIYSFIGGDGGYITPIEGYPLNSLAAYTWGGLDETGNPQGYVNGVKSSDYSSISENASKNHGNNSSVKFFGSATPQIYGSLINTINFETFNFSFGLSYAADYFFRNPVTSYTDLIRSGVTQNDLENRWKKEGDESQTNVPSFVYPMDSERDYFYRSSEINVYPGDQIRFEFVNFSWTHRHYLLSGKAKLSLFVNLSNLGVIWVKNKAGVDPDYPSRLRPAKTATLGIKIAL